MSSKPPCNICGVPSTTRCSRCKVVHYCSEACQRKGWPSHKIACTPSAAPSAKPTPSSDTSSSSSKKSATATSQDTPSGPAPIRKVPPEARCTSLKFEYQPSADGVDENLVFFFHGLGDKINPGFVQLAQSMQLPQTATCCVQAPTPIPLLEQEGWQWFPSFNNMTGELLGPSSPERMLQVKQLVRPQLIKLLRHCIDHCKFDPRKIVLFGFSQGGEIALDLAAFGNLNLRAVVSVAGYLMEESHNVEPVGKQNTRVLILQGDKDEQRPVREAKDRFKYIQRMFGKDNTEQKIVDGMGHGMPNNESGWRPLMEFFARNLDHRDLGLEGMTDVFEIKP
ncbi:hypothetical protein BGX34_006437 [Mortierella sp. NVP85]|nr:hypothetical protein BGX34_006437 [Mortierella sp. NVP85]